MSAASSQHRPRYGDHPLPPYSYVPGFTPHPVSDPQGHMFGYAPAPAPPLNSRDWSRSAEYLHGVDLFNHGFYWEAHEAWESLWHAAGRRGPVALWLKALIKLAAAAVKLREGNPRGVQRHARRAKELLQEFSAALTAGGGTASPDFCGLGVNAVAQLAAHALQHAAADLQPNPDRILDEWLSLSKPA